MSIDQANTVDVHAHVVLRDSIGAAGRFGPEIGYTDGKPWFRIGDYVLHGVSYEGSPFMEVDLRLQAMDRAGIDFQVLSPNPLTYFHFIDTPEAIAFCRQHNDALAAIVAEHPGRLAGLAALPMQDVGAACEELKRAVEDLGLWGAGIGTDFGQPLDSPEMDRLYEALVALDVPLSIHPAPAGIDGPAGDPNLAAFDLHILAGFAAQETLAAAHLIYGGVLHRHPELRVVLSHAGGAVPQLVGRLSEASRRRPWAPEFLRQEGSFEAELARLWFDTHVLDARVQDFVVSILGPDHLLMGTNFAGWDQHEVRLEGQWQRRLADNARRLFRRHAVGQPR